MVLSRRPITGNTLTCLLEMLHSKQLSSSKCWLTVITVSTANRIEPAAGQPMSASLIGRLRSSAFETIHHHSFDVARGLMLLSGIGGKALVWSFRCQGVC